MTRRVMKPAMTFAGALLAWAALTLTTPQTASATVADDFWPLVIQADSAVWGTLTGLEERGDDRLLEVSVSETVLPLGLRGPSVLRLVEPAGRLPEGTPLRQGAFGLFLFSTALDGTGPTVPVDGVFIPHGFLHGDPGSVDRAAVASLLTSARDVEPQERSSDALFLLGSAHVRVRRLAIGWLRRNDVSLNEPDLQKIRQAFEQEASPLLQEKFLDLFVLRDQPLAEGTAAQILPACSHAGLKEMTLHYLDRLGTTLDKGMLLGAYPEADLTQRCRLLEAYARLDMHEALIWWEDALTSDATDLQIAALRAFGSAGLAEGVAVYEQLLDSQSPAVRKLALRGLASAATPEAIQVLTTFRDATTADEDMGIFVRSLLKHPYRHGKPAQPRKSQLNHAR
ncbi:MAG: HEAT repeat domain-containing protein [Planctomycetota bacterium]